MKDFIEIAANDVWNRLRAGKGVYAVVADDIHFKTGVYALREALIRDIEYFIGNHDNVIFYERKEN